MTRNPPGNEGCHASESFYPVWWRDEQRVAWYATSDVEASPFTQFGGDVNVRALAMILFSPCQLKAYHLLEGILKERASNMAAAVAQNLYRHGLDGRGVDLAAGGATAVSGVMMGEPVLGFIIGGLIFAGRSIREVWRHRRAAGRIRGEKAKDASNQIIVEMRRNMLMLKRRMVDAGQAAPTYEIPQLAEFRNGWLRSAWRLMHLFIGYNLRVAAINSLMSDQTLQDDRKAARAMAEMLVGERSRLLRIRRALEQLYVIEKGSFKRLEKHGERLDEDDLFDDRKMGCPSPDWLAIPSGVLLPVEVRRQYEIDRQAVEAASETETQRIDEKIADLEWRETEKTARIALGEIDVDLAPDPDPDPDD